MKISIDHLVRELQELTQKNINSVVRFISLSEDTLRYRPDPTAWNILECIAHLNIFGNHYIPHLLVKKPDTLHHPAGTYTSGWLGNKFALSMKPGQRGIKTFKGMDTIHSNPGKSVLEVFLSHQEQILQILSKAHVINLSRNRIPLSNTRLIKLKMGDILRLLVYHNERHVAQAERVLLDYKPMKQA